MTFNKFYISAIHTDFQQKGKDKQYYAEVTVKNILNNKYIRLNIRRRAFIDTEIELLSVFRNIIERACSFDNCFERYCEIQQLDVQSKKSKNKWRTAEHYAKLLKYLCDDNPQWLKSELDKTLDFSV